MSKMTKDSFRVLNGNEPEEGTVTAAAEKLADVIVEEKINLQTYASTKGLSWQEKSRLQYLVDSNQTAKEQTVPAWDKALKNC